MERFTLTRKITPIRPQVLISLALTVAIVVVYWQVRHFDFIYVYDDLEYVIENRHVHRGISVEGIAWALRTFHSANYHPLTWLSHMLDAQLYGVDPGQHHLTNVLFHIANTLLLFVLFYRMTGFAWRSGFVAALFALHPLHVESVAMIAERKDVLCTFFWMLTLLSYTTYTAQQKAGWYFVTLAGFVLGLLAKPMAVTLPFVLLLLDFWPLDRFKTPAGGVVKGPQLRSTVIRLILEKTPFFVLSAIASWVTFLAQLSKGAVAAPEVYPLAQRVTNAAVSYGSYLGKTFWPYPLAVFYPYRTTIAPWQFIAALLLIAAVTALVLIGFRKHPFLIVGWLWYLGTLVPVIGLVQVGDQAMADRYTYIPLIGIFILIAWGGAEILKNRRYKAFVCTAASAVIFPILMVLTWVQISTWSDGITLFRHAAGIFEGSWVIHNNLGAALHRKGENTAAIQQFKMALDISPGNADAHYNLAVFFGSQGKTAQAVAHYRKTLRMKPDHVEALNNLGGELIVRGDTADGIKYCQRALEIDPQYANAHSNIAVALTAAGKVNEAISHYRQALALMPDNVKLHRALGNLLVQKGRWREAQSHYARALELDPENEKAYRMMGDFLGDMGDFKGAEVYYSAALRLSPGNADIFNKLGIAHIRQGNIQEAIVFFQEALRLAPDHQNARRNLARARKNQQDRD
jgi:tetratricopeptide (TPR) repeat protein